MEKDETEHEDPKAKDSTITTMEACLKIQRELRQILLEETRASKLLKEAVHENFIA